jgi:hypothetical protein
MLLCSSVHGQCGIMLNPQLSFVEEEDSTSDTLHVRFTSITLPQLYPILCSFPHLIAVFSIPFRRVGCQLPMSADVGRRRTPCGVRKQFKH